MCWLLYMNLHFTKHTADGLFLLRDRKVKICLGRKLSPIINRWAVGIRMSWVDKKITQEVAFQHCSVRLLSITFQSSFGSAEFGKRFLQCAKRKTFKKKFPTRRAAFYYTQSSLWVILIYTYDIKLKLSKKTWKKVNDCLVDHLHFIDLNAFLLILT